MLVTPIVNDAPYPFSATFTSNGGKHLVKFAGSGWRSSGGKISVDLLMDNNIVATASVVTNEANSHKALVPVAVLISVAPGPHTFSVAPSSSATKLDQSDYFTVTVTETAPRIVAGSTDWGQGWKQYAQDGQKTVYLEVDTSAAGFSSTPVYVISLTGSYNMYLANGGANGVYSATPNGFSVFIRRFDDYDLPVETVINEWLWGINWIGIESV